MMRLFLTHGLFALIDDEDMEKVKDFSWYAAIVETSKEFKYYAMRQPSNIRVKREPRLHRFILNLQKGDYCQFIDGDSLNCQKANLKVTKQADRR
jgi:hypothetical protein